MTALRHGKVEWHCLGTAGVAVQYEMDACRQAWGWGGGSPAHLGAAKAREEFMNERSKLGEKPNVMVTRDQEA